MRTFGVPTSFVSSPGTEKERLLYTSASVASGFYTKHGFLVLSKPNSKYKSYSIVLPEIIRKVDSRYWQDAINGGVLMPKVLSKHMINTFKNTNLSAVEHKIVSKFKEDWKRIEKNAWVAIQKYFPLESKYIKSLEVRITKIGSLGSHYLLNRTKNQHLIINLREDSSAYEIINLLILALIYPLEKELSLSFTHRQTIRNFVMSRQEFRLLYPNFKPKTFDSPKIPIILKRKSEEYIKYLGMPNVIDPLKTINQNLSIFGVKEEKLINLLIKNKDEIVTYDQIADCIWGEGKFKSYWAINKLIQRIIKKIKSLKISNVQIVGIRGKGYSLRI